MVVAEIRHGNGGVAAATSTAVIVVGALSKVVKVMDGGGSGYTKLVMMMAIGVVVRLSNEGSLCL